MKKLLQSWTRKAWLAIWLQHRRRARAVVPPEPPAFTIVLSSDGHGNLTWTLTSPSEWGFNVYKSDDGVTWGHTYDGVDAGELSRDCSGEAGYFRICQCDWDGVDIPPYSNVVYSDGLVQQIVLSSDGHGRLSWTSVYPPPYGVNIVHFANDTQTIFASVPAGVSSWDCSGVAGAFFLVPRDSEGNGSGAMSGWVFSDGL